MREFLELAFSFPSVVFTVSTLLLLGFWLVSTFAGAGMSALDDFGFETDVDLDVDLDVDTDVDVSVDSDSAGLLRGALDFLGITGMPLLIALNLLSLLSWVFAMVAAVILRGSDNSVPVLLAIVVLLASFLLAGFLTGRFARRLSHVFVPTLAARRKHFVGSACTITTQRVTTDFGQAEVRDEEGGSLIVQVRCAKSNDLQAGDRALIFDLDASSGVYHVSPDKSLAS